jgi:hypothetical protein
MRTITYSRIKQPSTYSEKHPCIDCKREAKAKRYILKLLRIASGLCYCFPTRIRYTICDLRARKREVQKQHCADKLPTHGNEVVSNVVWYATDYGEAQFVWSELSVWVGSLCEGESEGSALDGWL